MKLYLCTLTFVGESESADDFGDTLLRALDGDKEAQSAVQATTPPHVVKVGDVAAKETA